MQLADEIFVGIDVCLQSLREGKKGWINPPLACNVLHAQYLECISRTHHDLFPQLQFIFKLASAS